MMLSIRLDSIHSGFSRPIISVFLIWLEMPHAQVLALPEEKDACGPALLPLCSISGSIPHSNLRGTMGQPELWVLRNLRFPRFVAKIELGYERARLWYSFPLDALAPNGVRGATATGSILTTFMIEEKKTRQRLKSEPKGPSERDIQIYELHRAGETAREIAEMFGLSEQSVWGICSKVRRFKTK